MHIFAKIILLASSMRFASAQIKPQMVQPDDNPGPFIKFSLYDSSRGPALFLQKVTATGVAAGSVTFRSLQDANVRIICPALGLTQTMDPRQATYRYHSYSWGELVYDASHEVWALSRGNEPFILNKNVGLDDYFSPMASKAMVCFAYDVRSPTQMEGKVEKKDTCTARIVYPDLVRGSSFALEQYGPPEASSFYLASLNTDGVAIGPVSFTNADHARPLHCPGVVATPPSDHLVAATQLIYDPSSSVWAIGEENQIAYYKDHANTTEVQGGLVCLQKC